MTQGILKTDELAAFDKSIEAIRTKLRNADIAIKEISNTIDTLDERGHSSDEEVLQILDIVHMKMQKLHDDILKDYSDIKQTFTRIRDGGASVIDSHITNIHKMKKRSSGPRVQNRHRNKGWKNRFKSEFDASGRNYSLQFDRGYL